MHPTIFHAMSCHVEEELMTGCGAWDEQALAVCGTMHPTVFHAMSCRVTPCGSSLWFKVLSLRCLSPMPSNQVFDRCVRGFRRLDQPFGTEKLTEKLTPTLIEYEVDVASFACAVQMGPMQLKRRSFSRMVRHTDALTLALIEQKLDVTSFARPLRTGWLLDLTFKCWHPRTVEYGHVWRRPRTL